MWSMCRPFDDASGKGREWHQDSGKRKLFLGAILINISVSPLLSIAVCSPLPLPVPDFPGSSRTKSSSSSSWTARISVYETITTCTLTFHALRAQAPEGEAQPSTEVDLFISTEKIMVLNTDLKEIVMDHSLRTISYIADIGDLLVLMARRRIAGSSSDEKAELSPSNSSSGNGGIAGGSSSSSGNGSSSNMMKHRVPKMICHVFESEEAQFIAQSIGQAFQVAYMEFLKANGIEDSSFVKEMDYQEVLNSQEIFGDELEMFAKKDKQKEVIVPKQKGEILGMVIVESGWGSMLPTVVIANMAHGSPASRCGHLNIGDQIIAINGISLVGLPLSACQSYIRVCAIRVSGHFVFPITPYSFRPLCVRACKFTVNAHTVAVRVVLCQSLVPDRHPRPEDVL